MVGGHEMASAFSFLHDSPSDSVHTHARKLATWGVLLVQLPAGRAGRVGTRPRGTACTGAAEL